jgi:hypothetical protein
VKLQMTPPSNTKVISKNMIPDANIGQDVLNYVKVRRRARHVRGQAQLGRKHTPRLQELPSFCVCLPLYNAGSWQDRRGDNTAAEQQQNILWSPPPKPPMAMHVCLLACLLPPQTTPNLALMWRPDIKKYNVFLMSTTDEPVKPFSNDHIGLTFPLPTPISNAFQVCLCTARHSTPHHITAWADQPDS